MDNKEKRKIINRFNNYYKERDLKIGGCYISNNPCFPEQIFRITEIGPVELRFMKKNRIIKYERWACKNYSRWYKIETTSSWETNSGISIFGDKIPKKFEKELKEELKEE